MSRAISDRGKVALVTGGTDGVGKEIARGLARRGRRVIVVGRDARKGSLAERELREATGNAEVYFVPADLSLAGEARRLGEEVARRWPALHSLVHCAGVVRGRRALTAEGVESNFAVNYRSRFTLTMQLLPLLEAAGRPREAARVVLVSGAARNGRIYFDDVNLTNNFNTLRVVWQFCQANDTFAVEFARRSDGNGSGGGVTITCLKLGVVKTNIRWEFPRWMRWLVPLVFDPLLAQAPREAAEPALSLLLGYRFEGLTGALFMKVRRFKRVAPAGEVRDPEYGRRLWGLSERLSEKMHDSSSPPDAGDTQSLDFRSGAA
ncbi:MAG TPA: SDR family NAD(P)-dependent oxidoreductase [Pyrinomonadaceae bacterium]|nr:SDR family NAD(P)-dependent oxidoreductase [Pyrinomonadaceae bacterium]